MKVRHIRRRGVQQMAATLMCRAYVAAQGPWHSFPCVDDAIAFLRGVRAQVAPLEQG